MIKGVNLGNWLVLEKWMSPDLFAGTEAEDETQLCSDLEDVAKRERLRVHRDSYVTERDFAYLANRHIDAVRIPVPFFIFGDYPPYVGCAEYLDRAFDWAEKYEIKILIDLHTVPDGQNGFDNGGICGVCKWHKNPAHVEFVLTVLERLTIRYRGRTALWGIEVLNEPISQELWDAIDLPHRYPPRDPEYARGSEPVPTGFLKDFYLRAYRRIRAQSQDVTIVFHDGFRIREWDGFFSSPQFERIIVDTHLYLMEVHARTRGREPWRIPRPHPGQVHPDRAGNDAAVPAHHRRVVSRADVPPGCRADPGATARVLPQPGLRPAGGLGRRGGLVLLELQAAHQRQPPRRLGPGQVSRTGVPACLSAPGVPW